MKLVNRLVELTSGDVQIDGRSVTSLDQTELRRGIGYVIQQIGLFPHMTVAENVATVPRLLGWSRPRSATASTSCSTSSSCLRGTTASATRRSSPAESASASASPVRSPPIPPVMLMDEPFGALDPITSTRLQKELIRIQDEVRKTIIFVTHDIDEAIILGDRIAILREGGCSRSTTRPRRSSPAPQTTSSPASSAPTAA